MIPAALTLDMWSTGMSAQRIAESLGGSRGTVNRIVAQARSISDPRAVIHLSARGKPIGNVRRAKELLVERPDIEVVHIPSRRQPRKLKGPPKTCKRGHPRSPENITIDSRGVRMCKACHRMRYTKSNKKRIFPNA